MGKDTKVPIVVLPEADALQKLRELLEEEKRQEGLYCPLDDEFLVRFLRAKKGDHAAAFKSIQSYYKLRESIPNFLFMLNPSTLRIHLESDLYMVLRKRDAQGRHIVVFNSRNWNPDVITLDEIIASGYLIMEELISYEETQLNGIVIIADHGKLTFTQMRKIAGQISLQHMKRFIAIYQGAFPARFKDLHIVNHPYIFDMLFKLARPFMSQKLKKRIHEHSYNVHKLQDFMSPDILPNSLGGTVPDDESFDLTFMDNLFQKDAYYKDITKYGYKTEVST